MKNSLLGVFLIAIGARAASMPQPGQMAPDFTLPSQDGSRISLHDFKGKWVVLYFYPKDGTMGCTIEAHNFQRDKPKYDQHHAVIVGVSVDSATFVAVSHEKGGPGIVIASRQSFAAPLS
jgi:peroxiredoxin Q/BCP